jgi:hypothetical protein
MNPVILHFGNAAFIDHVHHTEEVRRLEGAFLAGWLAARFSGPPA